MTDESELDQIAGEMAQSASHEFEERREEQEAFLETVAEEEGAEVLETTCNLVGEYTVPLKAQMHGELIDRLSAVHSKGQEIDANPEESFHEVSAVADEMCQILADVIDDPEWSKSLFYEVYQDNGFQALEALLESAFNALKQERERMEGAADGFRQK